MRISFEQDRRPQDAGHPKEADAVAQGDRRPDSKRPRADSKRPRADSKRLKKNRVDSPQLPDSLIGKFLLGCSPKEVVLALRDPLLTEGELLAICAHKTPPDDRLAKGPPGGATSLGGIPRPKAAPHEPDRPCASMDRAPPTSSLRRESRPPSPQGAPARGGQLLGGLDFPLTTGDRLVVFCVRRWRGVGH